MNMTVQRRWVMPIAWATAGVLVLSLAVREGLAQWREQAQWLALAQSAAGLQAGAALSVEQLQQSAAARQIVLHEVQPGEAGWQVRGQVADARVLQDWLQALQRDGARPLQWGLEQAEPGLGFDLVLAR